jgi:TRAP-type transport system small permease protein
LVTRLCTIAAHAIDAVLILGGAVVCLFVFGNVIARYVLNFDLAWVNEVGEAVFVWLTFLGGARAVRSMGHLAVLEFVEGLPQPLNRLLYAGMSALVAAILVLLIVYGALISIENMSQTMSVTRLPMGLVYWAAPVGSALALLFVAEHLANRADFAMAGAASRQDAEAAAKP